MPTYNFKDEDGEYYELVIPLNKLDEFKKDFPHLTQVHLVPPGMVSWTGTIDNKIDSGFKEVLSKISEAHPDTPLADRYGKKSIKKIKTKQAIEKHIGKFGTETSSAFVK